MSVAKTNKFIIVLSEYHSKLCDAADDLNKIFSIPLVVYVLELFTKNLVVLFNGVKFFLNAKCDAVPENIFANLLWSLLMMGILFAILTSSVRMCQNANSVGNQVHELARKNNILVTGEQLKYFSMQLVHCKIEFNVCGMFPLDYTVLFTVRVLNFYQILFLIYD